MKTEELLTTYPKATEVVREWFMKEMLKSFEDEEVPEDFKESMRIVGIPNGQLYKLIDVQPRILFDVFDENNLFIQIFKNNVGWTWEVGETVTADAFKERKEAEKYAINEAFILLEQTLNQNHEEIV